MTNRTLIVSILLYLVSLCGLQAQITDSTRIWNKALKGKLSVNDRVRYLNKVAACYWYVNTDSARFLSERYIEIGLRDSSVRYMTLAGVLKDSLVNRAGRDNMDELEMKYKSSLQDQQLKLLQSEKENERRRSVIIFISSTFLLVILMLVTIMFWLRQKRLRIINRSAITSKKLAENEVLLKEVEMEKLGLQKLLDEQEIARLNSDLHKKQQDMVFKSLMKANTNNVLKTVTESLSRFSIHLSRKKEQEEFNQMIFQLGKGLTSSPLDDFEQLFKDLHPSFYSNLCAACTGLSQNDLKLCAFIRLNLSSKDIASIINLSLSSIETGRSRLRKKLGLDAGDSLTSFLMNF